MDSTWKYYIVKYKFSIYDTIMHNKLKEIVLGHMTLAIPNLPIPFLNNSK